MLIDPQIHEQLDALVRRERRIRLWRGLAMAWAVAGCAGLVLRLIEQQMGWRSWLGMALIIMGAVVAAVVLYVRNQSRPANTRDIARKVETLHPELNGRLITVLQQQPGADGQLNFLQRRLVEETVDCSRKSDWADATPVSKLRLAQVAHGSALVLLVGALFLLRGSGGGGSLVRGTTSQGITVTPGNVSLERGSPLLVLARFSGRLPASVNLVTGTQSAGQRVPLLKSLGDPLFGGSVPEVTSNLVYHIEYGSQRTPDYTVSVYEHPRLERADAELDYPTYTGLPHKKVENTRRVSAVEGSHLDLALKFNKPVTSARLVARDKSGEAVALKVDPLAPAASLKEFSLDTSRSYDLQLIDSDGRTNKVPAEFVFEALKNRPPELRLTSPRGDVRPSALEELSFEGTVWDDFGVKAFGIAFAVNGKEPKFVELGSQVVGNEKKTFQHRLRLEELGIHPDELVSWFVWADDLGPDGQPRRTMGDLYFGEVRPFEEVFREGQGDGGGGSGMGQGGDNATAKLAELQKQIVNATWKLERDHGRSGDRKSGAPGTADPPNRPPARPDQHSFNTTGAEHELIARLVQMNRRYAVAGQAAPTQASEPVEARPRTSGSSTTKNQPVKYEDDAGVCTGFSGASA